MKTEVELISESWINDYLDLLNYAKEINDVEWQEEIIKTLQNKNEHLKKDVNEILQHRLWTKFDEINQQINDLFVQIRQTEEGREREFLREKLHDLKLERNSLYKKINSLTDDTRDFKTTR